MVRTSCSSGRDRLRPTSQPTPSATATATPIWISTIRVLRVASASASSRVSRPSASNFFTSLVIARSAAAMRPASSAAGASGSACNSVRTCVPAVRVRFEAARSVRDVEPVEHLLQPGMGGRIGERRAVAAMRSGEPQKLLLRLLDIGMPMNAWS